MGTLGGCGLLNRISQETMDNGEDELWLVAACTHTVTRQTPGAGFYDNQSPAERQQTTTIQTCLICLIDYQAPK